MMEENTDLVPVLVGFKKIDLLDSICEPNLPNNTGYPGTYRTRFTSSTNRTSPGSSFPGRSFSFSSLLTGIKRHGKWKTGEGTLKKREAYKKERISAEYETEIERFEKDFVFPLGLYRQSDNNPTRGYPDISDGIVRRKQQTQHAKLFYSSSESILTETDSGAFSGVSIPDTESEASESSGRSQYGVNKDNYSDEDIEKETGWQTIGFSSWTWLRSQPSDGNCEHSVLTTLTLTGSQTAECQERANVTGHKTDKCQGRVAMTRHKTEECSERVTVNGVCWHCN